MQERLRAFLFKKFPDAKSASGGKEVVIRCRFCGDSSSDIKARHLYLSLGNTEDGVPPMYLCFKCNERGILTADILKGMIDCSSEGEFLYSLNASNSKIVKISKNKLRPNKTFKIYNTYIRDSELSRAKLYYINKRLGLDLTYQDLLQNKIVLNLLDLLAYNKITKYTRYDSIVKELDDCSIGFLSIDNGFINLKNLRKKGEVNKYIDRRYNNYSIFDDAGNGRRFYCIPTRCNIVSPDPINIHIAEGPFDILSIFYNLNNGNREQNIYISIGGRSYINVIKLCLVSIGIMNCIFHLYIDNDVPNEKIKEISNLLSPIGIQVYIHRNVYLGEKDYGVKLEKIKDQIIRI